MIDYEKLLTKYIRHVSACEGIDYIREWMCDPRQTYGVVFTRDEYEELERLSNARL